MKSKSNFNDPEFIEEDARLEAQLELWRERRRGQK